MDNTNPVIAVAAADLKISWVNISQYVLGCLFLIFLILMIISGITWLATRKKEKVRGKKLFNFSLLGLVIVVVVFAGIILAYNI